LLNVCCTLNGLDSFHRVWASDFAVPNLREKDRKPQQTSAPQEQSPQHALTSSTLKLVVKRSIFVIAKPSFFLSYNIGSSCELQRFVYQVDPLVRSGDSKVGVAKWKGLSCRLCIMSKTEWHMQNYPHQRFTALD
jgi:hypothetical protein